MHIRRYTAKHVRASKDGIKSERAVKVHGNQQPDHCQGQFPFTLFVSIMSVKDGGNRLRRRCLSKRIEREWLRKLTCARDIA